MNTGKLFYNNLNFSPLTHTSSQSFRSKKSQRDIQNEEQFNPIGKILSQKKIVYTQKNPSIKQTEEQKNKTQFTKKLYLTTQIDEQAHKNFLSNRTTLPSSGLNTPTVKNRYSKEGVAGKGTFGVVYIGKDLQTGDSVAHKKVLQDKRYKNRQLDIMKEIKHSNIIRLRDSFFTTENQAEYLNLIMDYYPQNLGEIIRKRTIDQSLMKIYLFQILKGLNHLNTISIAHRDIKPHNILVDHKTHKVAICDFGSAKRLSAFQKNLAYICSRCYRATQLIFGATKYTTQVDMWSLGCIVVQMINGQPPFLAQNQTKLLHKIIKVLGTPTEKDLQQMNPSYDPSLLANASDIKPEKWSNIVKTKDKNILDFISKVLVYSPLKRLTPLQALKHPLFDQFRSKKCLRYLQFKAGVDLSQLLQFHENEIQLKRHFELYQSKISTTNVKPYLQPQQKQQKQTNIKHDRFKFLLYHNLRKQKNNQY